MLLLLQKNTAAEAGEFFFALFDEQNFFLLFLLFLIFFLETFFQSGLAWPTTHKHIRSAEQQHAAAHSSATHSMQPAQKGGARQAQNAGDGAREDGWRLSYSVTPEEMRSVAMPEPQHRYAVFACSPPRVRVQLLLRRLVFVSWFSYLYFALRFVHFVHFVFDFPFCILILCALAF